MGQRTSGGGGKEITRVIALALAALLLAVAAAFTPWYQRGAPAVIEVRLPESSTVQR